MNDQVFQLVGILIAPAICSFSNLNLLDQTSVKPKETSTYLLEGILEMCVRNILNGGNPLQEFLVGLVQMILSRVQCQRRG